jgi:RNA polymerase sigma-70 factor (ECF subfamily)
MLAVSRRPSRDAIPGGGGAESRFRSMEENKTQNGQSSGGQPPGDYSRWSNIVEKIRAGDECGMEELYEVFSAGIRFYLCRHLGPQDLDDKIHDTFLIVVRAIRKGDLREPERLMGFVRTVARRQVAGFIEKVSQQRRDETDLETEMPMADGNLSPEEGAIARERVEIMKEVLRGISERDREILTRFYLKEQPQNQICDEMGLSETQFRLLKSRAKARFGEIGKRKMARRPLTRFLMRFSAGGEH